jgi:hypothetical protein
MLSRPVPRSAFFRLSAAPKSNRQSFNSFTPADSLELAVEMRCRIVWSAIIVVFGILIVFLLEDVCHIRPSEDLQVL